jgi:hypothetical protein
MVKNLVQDLVVSVTDVAVMFTMLLCGTEEGAVYVVVAPLAVWIGLKVPQGSPVETGQLQVTPALAVSLETVAP